MLTYDACAAGCNMSAVKLLKNNILGLFIF